MKKVLLLTLVLTAALPALAQEIELNEDGAYEKKEVVVVDSVEAAVLYSRAMEALSDWTGPDGKAKVGVDFHDRETGTVIYKGTFSLGFKSTLLGSGWNRYADFVLKVKCKDGKAQVTVTVDKIVAIYNRDNITSTSSLRELVETIRKAKKAKHERGVKLIDDLKETVDLIAASMAKRLQEGNDDDDF